jgi:hypothetical protein
LALTAETVKNGFGLRGCWQRGGDACEQNQGEHDDRAARSSGRKTSGVWGTHHSSFKLFETSPRVTYGVILKTQLLHKDLPQHFITLETLCQDEGICNPPF